MKRVVITGFGLISCIGNTKRQVIQSLQQGQAGITFQPAYKEIGMRSQVAGLVDVAELTEGIDRKHKRFMGDAALYSYLSMQQAIADSGLESEQISNPRTGLIAGSGGASSRGQVAVAQTVFNSGAKKVNPYMVPHTMGSTVSANLATFFSIKGTNFSISSACSTSSHCIGTAYEQIGYGLHDVMFAGGGEEEDWTVSCMFDAMRALSSSHNERPATASRPYDVHRDGFVIAGGGGIIVLEEFEHAKKRGAHIYAEIKGYSATSDGYDMVQPSGEGAVRAMQLATKNLDKPVDYINTHGTSTPAGDIVELNAIRTVFGNDTPAISSTKALTGHSLGATGVHEAIFCILMLENAFIAGSANIEELDQEAKKYNIVQQSTEKNLQLVMSNSFGFGGTNACLVFGKPD